ncbi:Dual specificity protein kinase pom1 [Dichanthelium oligosanthes]|uniref:Dual specificity protein kinase pom1 n=1 Tax=Dichanthelium oligosanthes TaxID=888268 RepID=A0A1E5UKM2_9POAL|nr:Dual specificity protein kinase pom1 [Dichanthelium oligosanthes]
MAAPGLDQVMAFLTDHGFAGAASALRDDVLARTAAGDAARDATLDPQLPPLRMPGSVFASGGGAGTPAPASPGSSSGSASSSAFVSMRSTPSGLLNPYGLWSPRHSQSDASSSELEFGTARQYDTTDLFFQEGWLYDDHLFPSKLLDDEDDEGREEDKFVLGAHDASERVEIGKHGAGHNHRHEHIGGDRCEGCAEVYTCSSPLCGCCGGGLKIDGLEVARSSSSTVYGRYQIMDDQTEILGDCAQDGFQLKQSGDAVFRCDMPRDPGRGDDDSELSVVEKELQMLSSFDTDAVADHGVHDFTDNGELDDSSDKNLKSSSDKEYLKEGHRIQPFPESGDPEEAYEFRNVGSLNADVRHSDALKAEEDPETNIDLALSKFHREYEVFDLRIIHRKNRTGFEENKDFPIVLNSVVAGRYYITEYLGSAAFSKVVQAHDLQTGMDVCLKIIKNDKDFFDQSLDEIKLLKFVNKYDPLDEHHVLRLYDYFYHQEHLFIVTELLRANLYEFQKYNQESGGEVYFTLPRIQVIARQCLEALVYLHHLRIIHCDLKPENILIKSYRRCEIKVIDLGSSCFLTDNLCLYVQSRSYRAPEVILGLPYDQRIDIWSLGCILAELYTGEVLFPNEPVSMMLAQMIGIIGPIDMEMLELGQETQNSLHCLIYIQETDQLEYLIPEKSSLRRHLQCPDSEFVDFLSYLLQINPRKRPTADEALQHPWLSFAY